MASKENPSAPSTADYIDLSNSDFIDPTQIDAFLNPYSMHHSFGSANVLVTQSLIGVENSSSWSRAIIMAILGKNKFGFVVC